jgi:type II secretion system protein G
MQRSKPLKLKLGFTLIELLVVIAIVGILSGFVLASMNSATNAAKDVKRKSDLSTIVKAITMFSIRNNAYPGGTGTPDTYPCNIGSTCTNLATDIQPYLGTLPIDPNGGFYIYSYDNSGQSFFVQSTLSNSYAYKYDSTTGNFSTTLPFTSPCVSGGGLTCVETIDGAYVVDKYILSGTATGTTTWNAPTGVTQVEYLVVAGGGAAGNSGGAIGGGGAGALRTATGFGVLGPITVTVGKGGANGASGSDSVFSTITSLGGGLGGKSSTAGSNGGSGGGAPNGNTSGFGLGSTGGNNGGVGYAWYGGGGGGGAGSAGGTATSTGGTGGAGINSDIILRGTFVGYAGGGGGSGSAGQGSASHGGAPGVASGNSPATANTGGGGGGSYGGGTGLGGSGIVVIRYLHP